MHIQCSNALYDYKWSNNEYCVIVTVFADPFADLCAAYSFPIRPDHYLAIFHTITHICMTMSYLMCGVIMLFMAMLII